MRAPLLLALLTLPQSASAQTKGETRPIDAGHCLPRYFGDESALRAIDQLGPIDIPQGREFCEYLQRNGLALNLQSTDGVMQGRTLAWASVGIVTADGLVTSRERHTTTIVADDSEPDSRKLLLEALTRSIAQIAAAPDSYLNSVPRALDGSGPCRCLAGDTSTQTRDGKVVSDERERGPAAIPR